MASPFQLEVYHRWLQHAPRLYDFCTTLTLEHPAPVVQWMPTSRYALPQRDYAVAQLAVGSAAAEVNHVNLYSVFLRTALEHTDLAEDDAVTFDAHHGRFEDVAPVAQRHCRFVHRGPVRSLQPSPHAPGLIAAKGTTADVALTELSKARPEPRDVAPHPDTLLRGGDSPSGSAMEWAPLAPSHIAAAGERDCINVFDVDGAADVGTVGPALSLQGHTAAVESVSWHSEFPTVLASASWDRSVRIWDTRDRQAQHTEALHHAPTTAATFHPNASYLLATTATDGAVRVWDLRSFRTPVAALHGHSEAVHGARWAPFDGALLMTHGADATVIVWDVTQAQGQEQMFVHHGHTAAVRGAAWAPFPEDEWAVASVDDHNTLQLWRPAAAIVGGSAHEIAVCCKAHQGSSGNAVVAVAVAPRGGVALLLSFSHVHLFALDPFPVEVATVALPECCTAAPFAVWNPNGRTFAVVVEGHTLLLFEADVAGYQVVRNEGGLEMPDGRERVALLHRTPLRHGRVSGVCATRADIIATTSSGHAVCVSWSTGAATALLNTAVFAQSAPADTVGGVVAALALHGPSAAVLLSDGSLGATAAGADPAGWATAAPRMAWVNVGAADSLAVEDTHRLIAVAGTGLASLQVHRFDAATHAIVPHGGLRGGRLEWLDNDEAAAAPISVQWIDAETLCAGVGPCGVALFHHSGAVLFTMFPRGEPGLSRLPGGCGCFGAGPHCLVVAPVHDGGRPGHFVVLPTASVLRRPDSHRPLLLHRQGLSAPRGDEGNGWDLLDLPVEYAEESPLRGGTASSDGQHVVCFGRRGFLVYSRPQRGWRLFGNKRHEQAFAVTGAPCWVNDTVVAVPSRDIRSGAFYLDFHSRHRLSEDARLARVAVPRRVVGCWAGRRATGSDQRWAVAAVDTAGDVRVVDVDLFVDDIAASRAAAINVGAVTVAATLPGVQWAVPVPDSSTGGAALLLLSGLTLALRTPHSPPRVLSEACVEAWWVPGAGSESLDSVVAVTTAQELLVWCRPFTAPTTATTALDPEHVPAGIDRGEVLGVSQRVSAAWPSLPPEYSVGLVPSPFQHAVLLHIFADAGAVPASARTALLEDLRADGCLVTSFDYLMHTVAHGPAQAGTNAADVLQRALRVLRTHVEFFDVIARCVRKADVAHWRLLFDVIGSPQLFFEDCVASNRVAEAVHVVRVLLLERPDDTTWSLEQTSASARRLLPELLRRSDFLTAYELLRFVALLDSEIELPPLEPPAPALTAIERALRTVWPTGAAHGFASPKPQQPTETPFQPSTADGPHALHRVFQRHADVRELFDREAQALLSSGRVLQLCRMFDVLDFSVAEYMAQRRPGPALQPLFQGLHTDLDLPRCPRLGGEPPAPGPWTSELARSVLDSAADLGCPSTQIALIAAEDSLETAAALRKLFAFVECWPYVLLLDVLLLRVPQILALLRQEPDLRPPLLDLLAHPDCAGYTPLLRRLEVAAKPAVLPRTASTMVL